MVDLNPFAAYAQGQQLGMARRAEERLMEDRAREEAERNRLSGLLAGGIPTTPGGQKAFVGEVAQRDPAAAFSWQKHFSGMSPDLLAQRKQEAPFFVSEFQNVTDQASYDQARSRAQGLGLDVSDMPEAYNPAQIGPMLEASRYLAEGPPEAAASGPFEGTAIQAQAANILLSKDPGSPEYAAAYGLMNRPRTYMDPGSGQIVSVAPDMSGFKPPAGRAVARPGAPAKAPEPMGIAGQAAGKVRDVTPGMTVTPIPGSKAAREAAEAAEAKEAREGQKEAKARIVLDEIGRVERLMEEATLPVTGFIGSRTKGIEGTAAADVDKILNTIRANVGFDQLNQMRQASKTGGALGAVSERENQLLQSVLGSLDQSLSEDEFTYNLRRLKDTFLDVIHGPGNRPSEEEVAAPIGAPTEAGAAPRVSNKDEYDALPSGTRYIAPDGKTRIKK